ncbi:MAG: hypothetical protein P0S96_05150 [Simkaniaceae bacterium]|nr:hypothetical protein [Candidatus Sacchlamyda saccharinae]
MLSIVLAAFCLFSPPDGWEIADAKTPSKRAVVGFVDKRKSGFCPSLNLTQEKISIPIQEYLAIVQKNCQAKKMKWRQLGNLETLSGKAYLVEIETKTKFGPSRLLQAILPYEDQVFILTAGVLKKDFAKHAPAIEKALRSMQVEKDLFALAGSKAEHLRTAWQKKDEGVESTSFTEKVLQLKELGLVWQLYMGKL